MNKYLTKVDILVQIFADEDLDEDLDERLTL